MVAAAQRRLGAPERILKVYSERGEIPRYGYRRTDRSSRRRTARGRARVPRRPRRRRRRIRRRRLPRRGPHRPPRLPRQRPRAGGARRPARRPRPARLRAGDTQQSAPSRRRPSRRGRPGTARGDRTGRPAWCRHRDLFLGAAGGRARRHDAQLDHRPVADRTRRGPRVPVGGGRDPVLEGPSRPRQRSRRRRRHRDAPEHARVRADGDARATGGDHRANRREPRSLTPLLARNRRDGGDPIARRPRRDSPRSRQRHQAVRVERSGERRPRHDGVHRGGRPLVAVPLDRLRPRRGPLEGRRLDAPDGRLRGALSIEHEDSLTASREGLRKAVDVLSRAVFETQPGDAYWAE
ncbi:MAG: AP endonuclease family 2 protein [uncultured archaeon A07HR67]|nr:MAG: AP endonuclease family 2 protein [uncultured archaeon A07HR67]